MGHRLDASMRRWLLDFRIHRLADERALDPSSTVYLYLVQQQKRLSLAASVGRLRPRNILLLPVIAAVVLLKTVDLWIANQIIRSLINEHDLMKLNIPVHPAAD